MALGKNCSTCLWGEASTKEKHVFCTCELSSHFDEDTPETTCCITYEEG
jgi:hypothetical protein